MVTTNGVVSPVVPEACRLARLLQPSDVVMTDSASRALYLRYRQTRNGEGPGVSGSNEMGK